jgi:hypothetical protein
VVGQRLGFQLRHHVQRWPLQIIGETDALGDCAWRGKRSYAGNGGKLETTSSHLVYTWIDCTASHWLCTFHCDVHGTNEGKMLDVLHGCRCDVTKGILTA